MHNMDEFSVIQHDKCEALITKRENTQPRLLIFHGKNSIVLVRCKNIETVKVSDFFNLLKV